MSRKPEMVKLHPLAEDLFGDAKNLPFEKGDKSMEGWYVWRLNEDWPVHEYKVLEVTDGIMVDSEPVDSSGCEWRVCENELYGWFFGPILHR